MHFLLLPKETLYEHFVVKLNIARRPFFSPLNRKVSEQLNVVPSQKAPSLKARGISLKCPRYFKLLKDRFLYDGSDKEQEAFVTTPHLPSPQPAMSSMKQ